MPHNGKIVIAALLLLLGSVGGLILTPTQLAPYAKAELKLEDIIPATFGDWRVVDNVGFVLPTEEDDQ